MIRHLFTILLLFLALISARPQDDTYIIKRVNYKNIPGSINLSPDGKLLLAGFSDGSFQLMDPLSFEPVLMVEEAHPKTVTALDMPPKMDFILTAGGNSIKLWDREGKHLGNLNGHSTTIWNVDMSNDGKHAVSSAFNKTFLLWDVFNGVISEYMRGHEDITLAVCISPDNKYIASGSNDLSVKVWDIESKKVVRTLPGCTQEIYELTFSPDSRLLAVGSKEKSIRVFDAHTGKLIHLLKGHREAVRSLSFSPEGRFLLSASEDRTLILWDVLKGERVHTFLDNEDAMFDVVFSTGGQSFYSISRSGDLTHWSLNPELFVIRYFEEEYQAELQADPDFAPRSKGEAKKDFRQRQSDASAKKEEIIQVYYQRYLEER